MQAAIDASTRTTASPKEASLPAANPATRNSSNADGCDLGRDRIVAAACSANNPCDCSQATFDQSEDRLVRVDVVGKGILLNLQYRIGTQGHDRFVSKANLQVTDVANMQRIACLYLGSSSQADVLIATNRGNVTHSDENTPSHFASLS